MRQCKLVSDDGTIITVVYAGAGSDLVIEGAYSSHSERDLYAEMGVDERRELHALAQYDAQQRTIDEVDRAD